MINISRPDLNNTEIIKLLNQLNAILAKIDGDELSFYKQFNLIDKIKHAVVACENGKPTGYGAIK